MRRSTSASVSALGRPAGHPGHLDVGRRVDGRQRPRRRRKRCSDRTATSDRATDAGALPVGAQVRRRRRSTSALVDVGRAPCPARRSQADVRAQVAPVGRERVRRPAPLDAQPGEELLDLERQVGVASRSHAARSPSTARRPRRSRASSRPMIVLASVSSPAGDQRRHVVERRRARWSCAPPRCPAGRSAPRCRSVARYDVRVLVAEARRVVELGEQLESAGRACRPPRPARGARSPRAARRRRRACRRGSRAARRRSAARYWRTSTTVAVVEQRHHRHRARDGGRRRARTSSPSGASNVPTADARSRGRR